MQNNQEIKLILLEDLGLLNTSEKSKEKRKYGLYLCHCGNEFKSQQRHIINNNIKSCGCLRGVKHGFKSHRLYYVWKQMINRCTNKNNKDYKEYGLRGISVCDEWLDINNFIEDMCPSYLEGLKIDRIDNNKGYSKDNCRWVNQNIQSRNTRKIRANNKSGYRGVSWYKNYNKWVALIRVNNKCINLGYFTDKLEAAKAYDNYIICNNLEHTKNF